MFTYQFFSIVYGLFHYFSFNENYKLSEICIALGTKNVLRHTGSEYIITHEITFFPIEAKHLTQNLKTL